MNYIDPLVVACSLVCWVKKQSVLIVACFYVIVKHVSNNIRSFSADLTLYTVVSVSVTHKTNSFHIYPAVILLLDFSWFILTITYSILICHCFITYFSTHVCRGGQTVMVRLTKTDLFIISDHCWSVSSSQYFNASVTAPFDRVVEDFWSPILTISNSTGILPGK